MTAISEQPAGPEPLASAGKAVLVVEDDPGIASQLGRALSRGGDRVSHVGTGEQALRSPDPDVVLLDLGLPDTDGVQVCRRLRHRWGAALIVSPGQGEEPSRGAR